MIDSDCLASNWRERILPPKYGCILLCWKYEEIDLTYRSIGMGYSIINYKHTALYHLYDRSNRKQVDHAEIFLSDCNERMKSKLNDEYTKKVNDYYNINFFDFL